MSFTAMVCPACQREIQVPGDIPNPSCPYCGATVGSIGAAPTATVATLMGMAQSAALAGNNEEALNYFNRVLEADPRNAEAWIGKGKAAAWQTTLANFRIGEMLVAFGHAIANSETSMRTATVQSAVFDANHLIVTIYNLARDHMLEYVSLPNSWPDYVGQMGQVISALETVLEWDSNDKTTLENIIHICKDNIEGVNYRDPYNNNAPGAWTLAPHYENQLKLKMDEAAERLRTLDPSYAPPAIEKKKADDCFVVTATMGNPLHTDVVYLQKFRDEWLRKRRWGIRLIEYYYIHGPKAAAYISGSYLRRKFSHRLIVRPAVWIAGRLTQ